MLDIEKASKYVGLSKGTLRNYQKKGLITTFLTKGGHRRFLKEDLDVLIGVKKTSCDKITVGYCRVSTSEQKGDLDRQAELVGLFCASRGYQYRIISDVGSGLNYNKKGLIELIKLINNKEVERIVVNCKDRLIRFGIEIIEQLCELNGVELLVINSTEEKTYEEELVEDVLSLITVFSSKLYGSRSHKTKTILTENKKQFVK